MFFYILILLHYSLLVNYYIKIITFISFLIFIINLNILYDKGENCMGTKGMDFKHKEVINIKDGKRLGFVQDVTADLDTRDNYFYNCSGYYKTI